MQINNIRQYSFNPKDQMFFDTNIWLLIYGPQSPSDFERQRIYSGAFREILSQGLKIYIDILVLSEIINKLTRFSFDLWCNEHNLTLDFKQFRSMEEYKPIAQEVEKTSLLILGDSIAIDDNFSKMDTTKLLQEYCNYNQDFTDLAINELCNSRDLLLVTDDGDFSGLNCKILTANKRLIAG